MISWKTLLPLLFLLSLTLFATVMVNSHYRAVLERQIRDEDRRLESAVFRVYYREYQRITLVVHSLKQLEGLSEGELTPSLEKLMKTYGREGQGLISAVFLESAGGNYMLSPPPEGSSDWVKTAAAPYQNEPPPPLEPGDMQIRAGDDGSFYLVNAPDEDLLIALKLDRESIERIYAEPAVREALSDYDLQWMDMEKETYRNLKDLSRSRPYPFNPLRALTGFSHGSDIKLAVSLPSGPDVRHPGNDVELVPVRPAPGEDEGMFNDGSPFQYSGRVLLIGHEDAPYYFEMEKRTVLNWLLSQLILYGTVLVILVLSLQLRNARELRSREKEFIASMTHELRTPLTVIQSAADNLAKGIVPPENISRYGRVMQDQSRRLGSMIEEILMFSSLEARNGSPGKAIEMDLTGLVSELKEKFDTPAGEQDTVLTWNYDGVPPRVKSFPDEIHLVLSNLIANALCHSSSSEEGIRIIIRCLPSGRLRAAVEDSGPGISASEQKRVFDPFYRSRRSREQQTRGSGLGLYIAMKKTELTGGRLTLESPYRLLDGRKSSGCRFVMEIPCEFLQDEITGEISWP